MTVPRPDGELLTAFTRQADQTAFAELVQRHGPMVVRVAEAILRDRHGAEDIAQATFLVLARKAAGLRRRETVAPWLHRVAWRLAIDELRRRQRRQAREEENVRMNTPASPADLSAVHEELGALPDRYRGPLVLCYLEGQEQESVAQRLGLSATGLRKRLERARELLRKKLVRRGVTVGSVGALTALLSAESGAATLPATFVAATVKAATGGAVSTTVAALTKGALKAMFIAKVKAVSLAAAVCLVVVGTGVVVAKQVAGTATPVAAPVVNQTAPIQMAQNNPPATAPVTPPASAGTETNPPTVQPKVEPGVFTLRVTRDGLMQTAPHTLIIPVKITAVEQTPNGATDVPKVGERIGIHVPHSVENQKLLPGNCRVNLVRQRIAFKNNPKLDHWQYRFPNDFPATNIGDCQEVKAPIGNPANDPNVHPLVRVEDPASGMVVRALDGINSFSIAAYAKDGKMVWQVKLPRRAEGLTIANGKVFVQPDGSAYDLQTGTAEGKLR
jgi:RNA polymerase sigma-70 factor (ECF subfamily)